MKKKKYPLLIGVLITFCLVSVFNVFAHSGRTDANGGHWDRSTGEYHYHTGEYAGRNQSSSNSKNTKLEQWKKNYGETDKTHSESSNQAVLNSDTVTTKKSNRSLGGLVFTICFCGFYVLAILSFIAPYIIIAVSKFIAWFKKYLPRHKINVLNEKIDRFQSYQNEISEINRKIFDLQIKSQIPDFYEIGKDDLPKEKKCVSNWGKTFTLYRTIKGKKLHTKYNCCFATKPSHIHNYKSYRDFSAFLCKKCANNYVLPDMSWYENYLNCKRTTTERQITINNSERLRKEIGVLYKKCNSPRIRLLIIFSSKSKEALCEANKKYSLMQKGTSLYDRLLKIGTIQMGENHRRNVQFPRKKEKNKSVLFQKDTTPRKCGISDFESLVITEELQKEGGNSWQ